MHLVLFRHAERENSGVANPPLTNRGLAQAEQLVSLVQTGKVSKPKRLLVSPRLRTHQTFEPVARTFGLELQMTPELDERQSSETAPLFSARVRRFLNLLERQDSCTFVCSHLDWIEEALLAIPSSSDLLVEAHQAWTPGQFIEFEIRDGIWDVVHSGRIPW